MTALDDGLVRGEDGVARCWWCGGHTDYQAYHDAEWGFPVADDVRLFEKLVLEGFQSGLSWLTILRKRENFRAAFAGFDIDAVAEFGEADVTRLLGDAGIVRHRKKIESAVNNARRAQALRAEFGSLAAYVWSYAKRVSDRPAVVTKSALMAMPKTEASTALAKDLRARGWSFVGPTTMYAFMQSMGLVNDHIEGCEARDRAEAARAAFTAPS